MLHVCICQHLHILYIFLFTHSYLSSSINTLVFIYSKLHDFQFQSTKFAYSSWPRYLIANKFEKLFLYTLKISPSIKYIFLCVCDMLQLNGLIWNKWNICAIQLQEELQWHHAVFHGVIKIIIYTDWDQVAI
jgi:hypothetical protein